MIGSRSRGLVPDIEVAAPQADGADAPDGAAPVSCPASAILSCLRRPQQERGQRRVTAILDAAAALITEVGPGGLTVQALAERAQTSKGSLYHFFPDLPAVLRALADRHVEAIGALTQAMIADPTIHWRELGVEDAVARFIAPLAYLESHPDLLALARTPVLADERMRRLTPLCDLADHLLTQRYPSLSAHDRHIRASTMVAVLDGIVSYGLRSENVDAHEMVVELSRVLGAYLRTLDTL
jgi:AcrR family transcriptional regulator